MAPKPAAQPAEVPSMAEMQQGAEVIAAGTAAAEAETDPTQRRDAAAGAIQQTAKEKGWQLDQAQAEMLADMIADKLADRTADRTVDRIRDAGGFDRLPDPVQPPAAPNGAGTLPAEPPAGPDVPAEQAPAPPKTFAARFRSGSR